MVIKENYLIKTKPCEFLKAKQSRQIYLYKFVLLSVLQIKRIYKYIGTVSAKYKFPVGGAKGSCGILLGRLTG